MIQEQEVMPLILKACPEFQPKWQQYLSQWKDIERDIYRDLREVAYYIVECYRARRIQEFSSFFEVVEQLLIDGDENVHNSIVVGLLEDIQNVASHESFGYEVFYESLGPVSRKAWDDVEARWKGRNSLSDVLRAEAGQEISPTDSSKSIPDFNQAESEEVKKILRAAYRSAPSQHNSNPEAKTNHSPESKLGLLVGAILSIGFALILLTTTFILLLSNDELSIIKRILYFIAAGVLIPSMFAMVGWSYLRKLRQVN